MRLVVFGTNASILRHCLLQPLGTALPTWAYVGGEVFNESVDKGTSYAEFCLRVNDKARRGGEEGCLGRIQDRLFRAGRADLLAQVSRARRADEPARADFHLGRRRS